MPNLAKSRSRRHRSRKGGKRTVRSRTARRTRRGGNLAAVIKEAAVPLVLTAAAIKHGRKKGRKGRKTRRRR